jgi:hypothetical protein
MFKNKSFNKDQLRKGARKMKNILICMVAVIVVAFCATGAWAAASQTVNVNAVVPTVSGGLTVTVSKVIGTTLTTDTAINFGTLALDATTNIFKPADGRYYAVDVGVKDNSGTIWTITHTRNSFKKDATNNLDSNVNVSFVKQTSASVGTVLQKVSFNNSNNVAYTKTQLSGGWLRLYYGIASGDPAKPDATGVTPIGLDKPAGTYAGSVTITLTP